MAANPFHWRNRCHRQGVRLRRRPHEFSGAHTSAAEVLHYKYVAMRPYFLAAHL
jgi:hypothetical protein